MESVDVADFVVVVTMCRFANQDAQQRQSLTNVLDVLLAGFEQRFLGDLRPVACSGVGRGAGFDSDDVSHCVRFPLLVAM